MTTSPSNHPRIGLITHPLIEGKDRHGLVKSFLQILEPLAEEIYLVTGNYPQSAVFSPKIHLMNIKYDTKKQSVVVRAFKYVIGQVKLSWNLAKITNKLDLVIYFLATPLLLPMLTAKLLRKKVMLVTTGLESWSAGAEQGRQKSLFDIEGPIFSGIISIGERLNYKLANRIVVYSPSLIRPLGLENYRNKTLVAHRHFLDFSRFKVKKPLNERGNLVGYIGRLSEEKGVLNFIEAMPGLLEMKGELEFLIGGDGQLFNEIEEYLRKMNLSGRVNLVGWIPYDKTADYLNKLRLLILPSYTEGLPNIMLEAMACGTPVLATPVGSIPDIIKDGETGFIMEDNSPQCITNNVIRVFNHTKLEQIVQNARALTEREYTYEAAVERYEKILSNFSSKS